MEGCDMGGRKGVLMNGSMGCDYKWERDPRENYNRENWRGLGAMEEKGATEKMIRENHRA